MNLIERTAYVSRHFGVTISGSSLGQFYRAHGVKHRPSQMVYRSHLVRKEELDP